jgi:pyrimidine operon attenuation protein/uracil phosphoribosyltransferase
MTDPSTDDAQALAQRAAGAVRDVPALVRALVHGVAALCRPGSHLVGIATGGVWLAERLQVELKLPGEHSVLSSAMHRDDFAQRGLSAREPTRLCFDVNGAHIVIVDDVLYTGRTIRAVVNELYDYGRPASVALAVLIDRDGRELPIQADFAATRIVLPADQTVALRRDAAGVLSVVIERRP